MRRSTRRVVICHGLGSSPSSSVSSVFTPCRCLPPSSWRASLRSSAEVSRRTRPISRRYIRTGSSSTSIDSAGSVLRSCSSASASGAASSVVSVPFSASGVSHCSSSPAMAMGAALAAGISSPSSEPSELTASTFRKISMIGSRSSVSSAAGSKKSSGFSSLAACRLLTMYSPCLNQASVIRGTARVNGPVPRCIFLFLSFAG